ncbi:MAG: hypothetical protein SFV52_15900 [Saprospiraceae bacterium]|nr:hypothetical protein [Saprospiraceae bacterium]
MGATTTQRERNFLLRLLFYFCFAFTFTSLFSDLLSALVGKDMGLKSPWVHYALALVLAAIVLWLGGERGGKR